MAENIADLIDGYYRLFTTSDVSIWDKSTPKTPPASVTNSLEKRREDKHYVADNDDESKLLNVRPVLNEDYSEIGLGEDEADYSTPTSEWL